MRRNARSSPRKTANTSWRHVFWRQQVVFNVGFLVGLSTLDIRDLWYKLVWVGPYDTYAFDAVSTSLSPSMPLPVRFSRFDAPPMSGWPSYLSRCETLTAFCSPGSTLFLKAMGRNCDVGVQNETKTIERLVMTSNVRADAMAWTACQLVHGHRQPPLCQANIVNNFMARYGLQGVLIAPEWMAPEDSAAEAELLRFIELIAMSQPRHCVVCTGGFAFDRPGRYNPTIFGCASASVFRADYVGVYATSFHELAYNMAWLTAIDIITVVEMSYKIRQNTINHFDMDEQVVDWRVAVSVTETTANNFVSSGLLYAVMITIDILLLCSQMYTGVELVTQWILPLMRKQDQHDFEATLPLLANQSVSERTLDDGAELDVRPPTPVDSQEEEEERLFSQEDYTSFLTTSLYRHPVVVVLTVVSQFLSWGLITPNSVVWTWSMSNYPKTMAYFSSLRLWTLILIAVNLVWDVAVFCSEKRAYFVARDTYITSFEIIAIGAIRVNDVVSFPSYIAHGNTFNEELDYAPISQFSLLRTVYEPLVKMLGLSLLAVFLSAEHRATDPVDGEKCNGEVLLRPPIHLDFGLFVRERRIATRSGFEYIVRAVTQLPVPVASGHSTHRPKPPGENATPSPPLGFFVGPRLFDTKNSSHHTVNALYPPKSLAMNEAQLGGWHSFKSRLQMIRNIGFLVLMTFLDVRDLWYKLTWVGPYDAYAFDAGSRGTLLPTPLPVLKTLPAPLASIDDDIASGWPSYTSRCENLTPFCSPGSTFFLNAMMRNCDVAVKNETKSIARLVMTSNVRSDSLAWGACQLLYGHRRPTVCQQNIVANFLNRYRFQATPVLREWMAEPDTNAEAEVLRFLEVIAMSYPRYRIICTGGFDYQRPGEYHPTIFGCASASVYRAEFIGVYATGIRELMFNKAWLTAIDIVTMVDVSYRFRQNTINKYLMEEETIYGKIALSITESTINNFVASGMLYVLMIVVDCILLLSSMYTGVELVTQWILPLLHKRDELDFEKEMRNHAGSNAHLLTNLKEDAKAAAAAAAEDKALFSEEEYTSFLSTSLYRHPVVVVLTVITQFISWGIIIPNSVVWTWSLSNYSKVMAFFSSLRIWTLILVGVNFVWDIVVIISEKHAYALSRSIFITSFEVMGIGAIVAFSMKDEVMAISETKFGIEHQRVNDFSSFPTFIAHGNTFNEDLDYSQNSEGSLLYEMYMPLIRIVMYSILGVYVWVFVKLGLWMLLDTPPMLRLIHTLRRLTGQATKHYHPEALSADPETRRKQMRNSAHAIDPIQTEYFRIPVEKILGMPMRARSLVRPTLSMQKEVNGETILRPAIHLDFGVFIRERKMTARAGFEWVVRAVAPLPPPLTGKSTRSLAVASRAPSTRVLGNDDEEARREADEKKARELVDREEQLQMKRMSRSGKGAVVHATNDD